MESRRRAILGAVLATALAAGWAGCAAPTRTSPRPTGAVVEVVVGTDPGAGLRFLPEQVTAPPGTAVRLTFHNVSTQPHNLTFEAPIDAATRTIVEPGATEAVDLVTAAPGRYSFVCTIHLGMSGTLTVK